MKIAVDVLSVRPDGSAGGATGFAAELIRGFAKAEDTVVYVLCAEWNIEYLKSILPANVVFLLIGTPNKITGLERVDNFLFKIRKKFEKRQLLKDKGIDILYCPFSAVTNKETGIPTVSTILDIQHEYYPQFFTNEELEHRKKFYREIVKKADAVTCISDYTKKTFCEKYNYPEERAHTIYIAIQNRFVREDNRVLARLGLIGKKYILYPANFWEHKNHKLLLISFAMYMQENPDANLVLTGNPLDKQTYYDNLITGLGLGKKVVITGYVTNEELYSLLKHAKGLVFPSLFEGFGIPVIEAMQQNIPIACSNLTSLPEIGGDSIFYFNPKKPDEVVSGLRYLYDTEVTLDMVKSYEETLKKYRSEDMINAYLRLFKNVIANKELLTFEECFEGVYEDGWSGEEICIHLKNKCGNKVVLLFELPGFVKQNIGIQITFEGKSKDFRLNAGREFYFERKITKENAEIMIRFKNCWCPHMVLKNEDNRILGALVKKAELISEDGTVMPIEKD